jgi:hypothetical protein
MRKYLLIGFAAILWLNVFAQNEKEKNNTLPPQKDTTAIKQDLKDASPDMPIITDFSEYIQYTDIDSLDRMDNNLEITIPKSVFILYLNNLTRQMPKEPKVQYPLISNDELKKLGTGGSGASFEEALEYIFWKSARAKKHNKKHANAWKTY